MRDLTDVIDQIITVVPENQTSLIMELKDRKDSCFYTAPEAIVYRWGEVAKILYEELGDPPFDDDWKGEVLSVWMGKKVNVN